jgi:hypothetical protein
MIDPTSKKFIPLVSPNDWLFTYRGVNNTLKSIPNQQDFPFTGLQAGTILYGLYTAGSSTVLQVNVPYYTVTYQLGGTAGTSCAPGTANLLRVENNSAQPILSCVLDFQIALGLDTDDDGSLDSWDNGGVQAGSWSGLTGPTVLNRRLKQIRLYILVQEGNQDPNYTYNNPDSTYLAAQHKTSEWIRVGDINLQGGAIGHDLQLSVAQRSYRWKVLSYAITPRNIR